MLEAARNGPGLLKHTDEFQRKLPEKFLSNDRYAKEATNIALQLGVLALAIVISPRLHVCVADSLDLLIF